MLTPASGVRERVTRGATGATVVALGMANFWRDFKHAWAGTQPEFTGARSACRHPHNIEQLLSEKRVFSSCGRWARALLQSDVAAGQRRANGS